MRPEFILFTSRLHLAMLWSMPASLSTLLPKTSMLLKLRAKISS